MPKQPDCGIMRERSQLAHEKAKIEFFLNDLIRFHAQYGFIHRRQHRDICLLIVGELMENFSIFLLFFASFSLDGKRDSFEMIAFDMINKFRVRR